MNTASMRSVRNVALPVPWARRRASASSPATPMVAAAAQAAGEPLDTKPVSMAIDEVYDGRLQVVHKD